MFCNDKTFLVITMFYNGNKTFLVITMFFNDKTFFVIKMFSNENNKMSPNNNVLMITKCLLCNNDVL